MKAKSWQESFILDFKTATSPMVKDDRKNLAEALSGFANSDGGVVVWGVYARARSNGEPDEVQELRPIPCLDVFLSDLQGLTPQLTSPGVVGVRHHPIHRAGDADGFAATLVPRSESHLHMAMGPDQHRYYYRSGSSFLMMEAYMVADRLGRRPQPKLELSCRLQRGAVISSRVRIEVIVGIKNTGRGVALYPALALRKPDGWNFSEYGLDGNGHFGLPRRARSGDPYGTTALMFAGGSDVAVYPDTVLEVTCLRTEVPLGADKLPNLLIEHELYCDGFSDVGQSDVPVAEFIRSAVQSA